MKTKLFLLLVFFLLAISSTVFSQNVWTQKANYPGAEWVYAVGFSIGTKAYLGTGCNGFSSTSTNEFWEYDPSTNVWTQLANFGGGIRSATVGFSIGTKG